VEVVGAFIILTVRLRNTVVLAVLEVLMMQAVLLV